MFRDWYLEVGLVAGLQILIPNQRPMNWKQPIDTRLIYDFGDDYLAHLLYVMLILRAANKDGFFTDSRGATLPIKRGQVVFGRRAFNNYLAQDSKDDGKKLERTLVKLEEIYQKVTREVTRSKHTIVTLLDYENLVSLDPVIDPTVTLPRPYRDPTVTTSKSVKSEENEKQINTTLDQTVIDSLVREYNLARKRNIRGLSPDLQKSISYWLEFHPLEDMLEAIRMQPTVSSNFLSSLDLNALFRKKNNAGPCDYIEQILTLKTTKLF